MADTAASHAGDTGDAGHAPGRGEWIGLAVLFAYVVVLALGTVAAEFDIRWLLDLPVY